LPSPLRASVELSRLSLDNSSLARPGFKFRLVLGRDSARGVRRELADGVPLQLHSPDPDEDVEIARDLAATVPGAELFEYPGADHLFLDRSHAGYDEVAAAQVTRRVLGFLR
jgi:hypothetical protein